MLILVYFIPLMLILASSSPYRKTLLEKLQLEFQSIAPDIDESRYENESAEALVQRLAFEKAKKIKQEYSGDIVIASDQVAVVEGSILTKPHTMENAQQQLANMSGKRVDFLTSLCVMGEHIQESVEVFSVYFRTLSSAEIKSYIAKEAVLDCAGSFKSEGLGISLFSKMVGEDPNTLIGLPLIRLIEFLRKEHIKVLS